MSAVIFTRELRKFYPVTTGFLARKSQLFVHAVDGVDLDLMEDETLALVGESGCGKTTLGQLILALQKPTSGTISWAGQSLADMSVEEMRCFRRNVQVVFQDSYGSLNPHLTVRTIIRRPLILHGIVPSSEIDAEVMRLLDLVGLRPPHAYIDRFPHEFSGGQRQRIAIARALGLRPRVIFVDEPVSALDVSVRAQILNLLNDLRRTFSISMLFTTHDLGVVRFIADRVAVMYLGKIVEVASGEAFFNKTHHPYSTMLLRSALSPNPAASLDKRKAEVFGEPPSPIDPPSGCRFRTRCPFVFARCETDEPLLHAVGQGHLSACHLGSEAMSGMLV